jgi:excinuclease UvrABC nuclease subunit
MTDSGWNAIFDGHADFDPAGDFDAFVRQVPARWVVYLLADEADRPAQLLCVKNLRNSLKRRLGGGELAPAGPSRRVDYRELVRRVHWRRVDSAFEADWLYYEAARVCFPRTYPGMVGFRPAWFIHVNPDANFPRYVKTIDLTTKSGLYVGPLEDKHAAARLIELVEDCFDLCRYYNVLIESPNARACAYKEMGKCPAPCDGTISTGQYRHLVEWSAKVLNDPEAYVREQEARMRQAAAELRFEVAQKIKQYVEQLSQLGKGAFRHARRLKDFSFVSLQHGPRAGTAKVFLVTSGDVEEILGITADDFRPAEVMRVALERAAARESRGPTGSVDATGAERIGIVAHHLFAAKHRGVFLRLETIDEKAIARGFRDLKKQAPAPEDAEGEGVMKELQSL